MAPHPPLPSGVVDPPNTGAEKLLSPLAIADARLPEHRVGRDCIRAVARSRLEGSWATWSPGRTRHPGSHEIDEARRNRRRHASDAVSGRDRRCSGDRARRCGPSPRGRVASTPGPASDTRGSRRPRPDRDAGRESWSGSRHCDRHRSRSAPPSQRSEPRRGRCDATRAHAVRTRGPNRRLSHDQRGRRGHALAGDATVETRPTATA